MALEVVIRVGPDIYRGANRIDALCCVVQALMRELNASRPGSNTYALPFSDGTHKVVEVFAMEEETTEAPAEGVTP